MESFQVLFTCRVYTLSCTRATKEALRFWGCGQFLPFIIKRILGIKRIFPCSFGNKHMRLLTHIYTVIITIHAVLLRYHSLDILSFFDALSHVQMNLIVWL